MHESVLAASADTPTSSVNQTVLSVCCVPTAAAISPGLRCVDICVTASQPTAGRSCRGSWHKRAGNEYDIRGRGKDPGTRLESDRGLMETGHVHS